MSEVSTRWAIDAIENGIARIEEDGTRFISVPATMLPKGATAGQVLTVTRTATRFMVEFDETATREALARSKATMKTAMAESRRRDPGGDVAL